MTIAEQLGNAGAEYSRIISSKKANNAARFESARARYLELLDLTINDPRWSVNRKQEIQRLRELTSQNFPEKLQTYFDQFATLARSKH